MCAIYVRAYTTYSYMRQHIECVCVLGFRCKSVRSDMLFTPYVLWYYISLKNHIFFSFFFDGLHLFCQLVACCHTLFLLYSLFLIFAYMTLYYIIVLCHISYLVLLYHALDTLHYYYYYHLLSFLCVHLLATSFHPMYRIKCLYVD